MADREPLPAGSSGNRAAGAPAEGTGRSRTVYRRYYRWVRLSRIALGAFVMFAAIFLLWLVPWVPSGLDTSDYTPEMAFTIYLLGGVAIVGLLALGFQELARRDREALVVWGNVYDEATGLHNRTYLYDRLALECHRARRVGGVFTLVVFQLRVGRAGTKTASALSDAELRRIAGVIEQAVHRTDIVALLSDSELAVLAIGVDQQTRRPLLERLCRAIAGVLSSLVDEEVTSDVRAGAATWHVDGDDANVLVQAARTAVILAVPGRARAA